MFLKKGDQLYSIIMNGSTVERVNNWKFLGVNITEDLTWEYA